MKNKMTNNKIEAIGNGIALLLGLGFLGDVFELWSFNLFSGWWVLFLYIPAICGFLTKGITSGGVMLILTAIVLTVGMFIDMTGRLWGVALILYLAYLGGKSLYHQWNNPVDKQDDKDRDHHDL